MLATASKPQLTLYSRAYCHLCDDLLAGLEELRQEYGDGFDIETIDIDTDTTLLARYDELVPILVASEAGATRELCRHFLDASAVRLFLAGCGVTNQGVCRD